MKEILALQFIARILAVALTVHTLEFISLKNIFASQGLWRWDELRQEHSLLPQLDFLFADSKRFILFLYLRFFIAILFFFFPFNPFFALFLFLSTWALAVRFRGSFNGGSDYMSLLLLLSLSVANFKATPKVQAGVLWYMALQACSSYFIAGLVKIKQSDWRTGKALTHFIKSPNYNPPPIARRIFDQRQMAWFCSWIVMLVELAFPLILISGKKAAVIWLMLGFLFHLANAILFGLNRFLIIWMATYPALYFVASTLTPY